MRRMTREKRDAIRRGVERNQAWGGQGSDECDLYRPGGF
jgi:hypothetical protein